MNLENLCIPKYLNEKIVLDMFAMIEDGFSLTSNLTIDETKERTKNAEIRGDVGGDIHLFRLALRSVLKSQDKKASKEKSVVEKIHTPSSLFFKLKNELDENDITKKVNSKDEFDQLKVHDVVEIKGKLHRNPIIQFIDTIIEGFEVYTLIMSMDSKNPKDKKKLKEHYKELLGEFKKLRDKLNLTKDGVMDLVCEVKNEDFTYNVVVPVNVNYFVDNSMSEVINGEYKVLGKIVKKVDSDNGDRINLLRNTSFSLFADSILDSLIQQVNLLGTTIEEDSVDS